MMKHGVIMCFFTAFLVLYAYACTTPAVLMPKVGPGTDYPCDYYRDNWRIQGFSCGNHMCCDVGYVCGGKPFSGCPAGSCCADGNSPTMATRSIVPQRPEQ